MKKLLLLLMATWAAVAHATVYNVNNTMSASTINSTAATAAGSTGNTVQFAAGTYSLGASLNLPCTNGVIYQGIAITEPNTGNSPSVVINALGTGSFGSSTNYAIVIPSNGTGNTSYTTGCQIKWIKFSGLGGSIFVNYPSSGINIQSNYFTGNDGTPSCTGSCTSTLIGTSTAVPAIFFNGNCPTGSTGACNSSLGVSYVQVDSNVFNNNCASIRNVGYDAGALCTEVWTHGYNNFEKLTNNILNLMEEGFKWQEIWYQVNNVTNNLDVEDNLCEGNSRICLEDQQNTNGNVVISHNSYFNPGGQLSIAPNFNTFEISFPANNGNGGPTFTLNDDTLEAGQPASAGGSGNHYAIGFEVGGSNAKGQYNVFQGSNSSPTCGGAANGFCAAWNIIMFSNNAGQSWTNNYFSGNELWNGTPNDVTKAFGVEDGASLGNATITPNTVVQTSANLVTSTPTISPSSGSGAQTVTLSPPDTNRHYSIFYTTDGSTPCIFAIGASCGTTQLYTAPFGVSGGTTVRALAHWGQGANQGINFQAANANYFGWVPSSVVSVTYGGGGFYISPTGSDSNPGTLSQPWLTPNHAMTCGNIITALSGTYSASNFQNGKWGTVTCSGGNNVAWLICQTFDTCKIASTTGDAMWVDQSYWGIVGWEATTSSTPSGACFHAGPSGSSTIHHIIFADDIANGCMGGGFNAYDRSTSASVDYITYIGNIVWNAAQGTTACYSGLNIYQPIQSDGNSGTHMYVAGNFSFDNVDGPGCDSAGAGKTTDGEGINLDTFDFSQGGGTAYAQQAVVQNNIELLNGTRGIEVENNGFTHSTAGAPIFIKYNTMYGSGRDPNMAFPGGIAQLGIFQAFNVTGTNNLVYTGHQFTTGTNNYFALGMTSGNGTDTIDSNYAAGVSGNNTYLQSSSGFSFGGSNVLGTNPSFVSTADPGAPSCGSFSSTAACMATVVANFTPTVTAAKAYGYQTPSNTSITDALFPQWLCTGTGTLNPNIPQGLITPGCGGGSPTAATPVLSPGTESFYISVSVTVTDSTPGSTIYCTTDGSTPTTNSPVYSGAFTVTSTTTIKCIAAASGYNNSAVGSGTYTLLIPPLTSCSQTNAGPVNTLAIGATAQQIARCTYLASGETLTCSPGADKYGDVATAWNTTGAPITVGAIGNPAGCGGGLNGPGCVTGISGGTANSTLFVGSLRCADWTWTVLSSTGVNATISGGQLSGAQIQ